MKFLLPILVLLSFQVEAATISTSSISVTPGIVGEVDAEVNIFMQVKTETPANSYLKITIPSQVSVQTGTRNCVVVYDPTGTVDTYTPFNCVAISTQIIWIQMEALISPGMEISVTFDGINTPSSEAETSSFEITFYEQNTESSTAYDTLSTSLEIKVSADTIATLSGTQGHTTISTEVYAETSLEVTFTTGNVVEAGGIITMVFPKVNPEASSSAQIDMVNSGNTDFECQTLAKAALACTWDSGTDTLTITDFFGTELAAGSATGLYIQTITNPITQSAISIVLTTLSASSSAIESGTISYKASSAASILATSVTLTPNDSTIQETTTYTLQFATSVPLDEGCQVEVTFPPELTFDSSTLTIVTGSGAIVGSSRSLDFSYDTGSSSVKVTAACGSYSQEGLLFSLVYASLTNPDYVNESSALTVTVRDVNDLVVMKLVASQGVTVTPTTGAVTAMAMTAVDSDVINQDTAVLLEFTPLHSLPVDAQMTLSVDKTLLKLSCSFSAYSGFTSSGPSCSYKSTTNTLTLKSMFDVAAEDNGLYSYVAGSVLSLTFTSVTLPDSAIGVTDMVINTFWVNDGESVTYSVDEQTETASILDVQPDDFSSAFIQVSASETYSDATFAFEMTITNDVPKDGKIRVLIPPEIIVADVADIVCSEFDSTGANDLGLDSLTCTVEESIVGDYTYYLVWVSECFSSYSSKLSAGSEFILYLSGMKTPLSTKSTTSFEIATTDSLEYYIDSITSDLYVTMASGKQITEVTVEAASDVIGDIDSYRIYFTAPSPFLDTHFTHITFPDEILPAEQVTQNLCYSNRKVLQNRQYCEFTGQEAFITIVPKTAISVGDQLYYRIPDVRNPQTGDASSDFLIEIKDGEGYMVAESTGTAASVQLGTPAAMADFALTASDYDQGALTTLFLKFRTLHDVPVGGTLLVERNYHHFSIPDLDDFDCSATGVSQASPVCTLLDRNTIFVESLFTTAFSAGQLVTLALYGMQIDYYEKGETDSIVVTTQTASGNVIDWVETGLTLAFDCNSPCQTCRTGEPDFCGSCNKASGMTILFDDQCYAECPAGTWDAGEGNCEGCGDRCGACQQENPQFCTACNADSDYPYLIGNTCAGDCQFGYYADGRKGKCLQCNSDCETCIGSASNCVKCDQESKNKYQYGGKCVRTCPDGFTTTALSDGECVECDDSCKTCKGEQDYCTSCSNGLLLDEANSICTSSCPPGITIKNKSKNICEACDYLCDTCGGRTNFCTSCISNYFLRSDSGSCVKQCSPDHTQVAYFGTCTDCDQNCQTCQTTPTQCVSCFSDFFFYNYECVNQCPEGYEVFETSRKIQQCVIYGLVCPFGYEPMASGLACQLASQICEDGSVLNYSKTKCVPGSPSFIPFPLLITGIMCIIVSYLSSRRHKDSLFFTNSIAFLSILETIGILWLLLESDAMGVTPSIILSAIAFMFLVCCNLFFTFMFWKQVFPDHTFKYWASCYWKTTVFIMCCTLFNFKSSRLFYGKFLGLNNLDAPFNEPDYFYRPFSFFSLLNVITVVFPILVADCVVYVHIDWGHQLLGLAWETGIIILTIVVFSFFEFNAVTQKIDKEKGTYKAKPGGLLLDNVMAGVEFDESSMQMLEDEVDGKTKQPNGYLVSWQGEDEGPEDINLRQQQHQSDKKKTLEEIIQRLKVGKLGTKKEEDTTEAYIKKLQGKESKKMQRKRCDSFEEIRLIDDDFRANDSEIEQNYISCPGSPREFEMLHNPHFLGKMTELRKIYKDRDMFDNVYAEAQPTHYFPLRDCKLISVKVQTNVLELLGVGGEPDNEQQDENSEEYVEENLDSDYAQGLINGVINGMQDGRGRRKRRRLPKARLATIPEFQFEDIMGDFDLNEDGTKVEKLSRDGQFQVDCTGHKVNKMGYLVDGLKNVVKRDGVVVFKADEVDSDDEIPAPFCYEMKKLQLEQDQSKINQVQLQKDQILDNDDIIEQQYKKLQQAAKSNRSSVDSLTHATPSQYTKQNKRAGVDKNMDDEMFLQNIIKPVIPKTKDQLLKQAHKEDDDQSEVMSSVKRGGANFGDSSQKSSLKKQPQSSMQKKPPIGPNNRSSGIPVGEERKGSQFQGINSDSKNRPLSQNIPQFQMPNTVSERHQAFKGQAFAPGNRSSSMDHDAYKWAQLKKALGKEAGDEALIKKMDQFEMQQMQKKPKLGIKQSLARRQMEKVYNKVQHQRNENPHQFVRPDMKTGPMSIEDSEANFQQNMSRQITKKQGQNTQNPSRMKGLEKIYLQGVELDRKSALPERNKGQTMSTGAARFRDMSHTLREPGTGSQMEDEEQRLRNELEKEMIRLDKANSKLEKDGFFTAQQKRSTGNALSNKPILDGGWL